MHRGEQTGWRWNSLIWAAAIFALVLLNNIRPVFFESHYEMGDIGSNALQIIRAKRFDLVLGNYSRFGFYHPGPGFFYVYATAEALFYDLFRIVPTPSNAHLIGLYALSAFFFSAALRVIIRVLDPGSAKWFLSIALLLAAWHFGAVGQYYNFVPGRYGLFCIWPPCVLLFPFLCFLTAAASVASGRGRELPLMTLAACFLVHGHVAMSLFAVPISLLVYGTLVLRLRRNPGGVVAWPRNIFSRQHFVALGIILLFLLPIVIDLLISKPSNLGLIVEHLRKGYGGGKTFLRSLLYFLHFAAYASYPNSNTIPAFENFDLPGTLAFFGTHWRAYGLWVVLFTSLFVLNGASREVRRFLLHNYLVLGLAVVLTIVWGHLQEGPMYYFNALFNFAIYYSFLMIFAVKAAHAFASGSSPQDRRSRLKKIGPTLIALLAVGAFTSSAKEFRFRPQDSKEQQVFAATMERALKIDSSQSKLLVFEGQGWAEAVGVALCLERSGSDWRVAAYAPNIPIIFGRERAIPDKETAIYQPHASVWRIVSTESGLNILAKEPGVMVLPLAKDIDLVIRPSP